MVVQKLRRIYGGVLDGLSELDFDGKGKRGWPRLLNEKRASMVKELLSRFSIFENGWSGLYIYICCTLPMVMADAMVRMAWVALVETMSIERKATNLKG